MFAGLKLLVSITIVYQRQWQEQLAGFGRLPLPAATATFAETFYENDHFLYMIMNE